MKKIWRIALLDLKTFCYSPIVWLVLVIFSFQSSLHFLSAIKWLVKDHELNLLRHDVTNTIYAGRFGLFPQLVEYVYLYLPLVTMGVFSKEISSGSIKLLFSAPIKTSTIVLGKFSAMVVFCFFLTLIASLFILVGFYTVQNIDLLRLVAALFGLFLLLCTYSAVGVFISSLTSYQIVAALNTVALLGALNHFREIGQKYATVREASYLISLSDKIDPFLSGMLSSKLILYFLLVIVLFIGLSIFTLDFRQKKNSLFIQNIIIGCFVLSIIIIGYVSSRPGKIFYVDLSADHRNTISPSSQEILGKLSGPVEVTYFVNVLDLWSVPGNFAMPKNRNLYYDLWEQYQRYCPQVKLRFVYYYAPTDYSAMIASNPGVPLDSLALRVAGQGALNFKEILSPKELKKIADLAPEKFNLAIRIRSNQKESWLRLYPVAIPAGNPIDPGEGEIMAAFQRLLLPAPKISFVTGHYERDIFKRGAEQYRNFAVEKGFRKSLVNQGFDVSNINLQEQNIPNNTRVLIIADPRTPYLDSELDKIKQYLDDGGNLLLALEPDADRQAANLNALLGTKAVNLSSRKKEGSLDIKTTFFRKDFKDIIGFRALDKDSVSVPLQSALAFAKPLDPTFNYQYLLPANEEQFLAVKIRKNYHGREQRIFLIGDADLFSNGQYLYNSDVERLNENGKVNLGLSALKWLSGSAFPVNAEHKQHNDYGVTIGLSGLRLLRWLLLLILPGLLILTGAVILVYRKQK